MTDLKMPPAPVGWEWSPKPIRRNLDGVSIDYEQTVFLLSSTTSAYTADEGVRHIIYTMQKHRARTGAKRFRLVREFSVSYYGAETRLPNARHTLHGRKSDVRGQIVADITKYKLTGKWL